MALYCSPPWPVMVLVAEYLEPQTLAIGSCVSKSWNSIFSSDNLWTSHCLSHYPSSSVHLYAAADGNVSPRRIFVTLCVASKRRRPPPAAPRISLRDLIFTVDVFGGGGSQLAVSLAKQGEDLRESAPASGLFRFSVEVAGGFAVNAEEELRVIWMAVMKGCRGAFVMMDKVGKGRFVGDTEMFSEELPQAAACCELAAGRGRTLQSEVWLQVTEGDGEWKEGAGAGRRSRRRVIRKLTLGLMSSAARRYVGINDGLLYLLPYLLP